MIPVKGNIQKGLLFTVFAIAIVVVYASSGLQQITCPVAEKSSVWSIDSSNVSAQILWQREERKPRTTISVGSENSGVAASQTHFMFWQDGADSPSCTPQLYAFSASTGDEQWRFARDQFITFHQVVSLTDGYALVVDQSVIKLDFEGRKIWENNGFPSRSTQMLYEADRILYLPSNDKVYKLSSQTGKITEVIPIKYPIAYFDKYAVVANDEGSSLKVISLAESGRTISTLGLFDVAPLQQALPMLWPTTDRYKNTLIFYYNVYSPAPTHIDAYDLNTGKLVWRSTSDFYGLPIRVDDKLILYNSHGLQILDALNGQQLGWIKLSRTVNGVVDTIPQTHIWLAGYGNMIFINYRDTWDIVAIKLGLSQLDTSF
ncbi:MAG: PQQ-binding-like beta-propeller repeat protein [Chloroflexota bacterium]